MTHYDLETLFALMEGEALIEAGVEEHVAACGECAAEVEAQRRMMEALRDPRVWERRLVPPELVRRGVAFAERLAAEDQAAVAMCDEILTGPAAWWPQRLRKTDGAATAGMVRQLLVRMRVYVDRCPANALQVTELAVSLAAELNPADYPPHVVENIHGQALRDHAYVLAYMSRYAEALESVERSARLFDGVPASDCERARLALVRALVLRSMGDPWTAATLAREAGDTFLAFGEHARHVNARITEGVIVHATGSLERALEIWTSVQNDPSLDDVGAVRLAHNIALCLADLGQPWRAIELLGRCIAQFEMLGMETERTRSRAVLGKALVAVGNPHEAIPLLRQTSREFAEFGLIYDYGIVALEAADALIAANRWAEVPAICREVISRFTTAGLARQAITALSYLREAEAAAGTTSAPLVRAARTSLERCKKEPPPLFAPPPRDDR